MYVFNYETITTIKIVSVSLPAEAAVPLSNALLLSPFPCLHKTTNLLWSLEMGLLFLEFDVNPERTLFCLIFFLTPQHIHFGIHLCRCVYQ